MIVDLYPFTKIPAKAMIVRRSDFAVFYQVIVENLYAPLLKEIREGDVVIDAGANIGLFSILASFKVGKGGTVIAIEPEKENLKLLNKNIELNRINNIVVIPKALYDISGKKVSMKGEGVGAYVSEETEGDVETITLDEITSTLGLKPRILKMDIEGSEGKALLGGTSTIRFLEYVEMEIHDEENMRVVNEVLRDFKREDLKVENFNNVIKTFFMHPVLLLKIEATNNFSTTKRVIRSSINKIKTRNLRTAPFPIQVLYRKKL